MFSSLMKEGESDEFLPRLDPSIPARLPPLRRADPSIQVPLKPGLILPPEIVGEIVCLMVADIIALLTLFFQIRFLPSHKLRYPKNPNVLTLEILNPLDSQPTDGVTSSSSSVDRLDGVRIFLNCLLLSKAVYEYLTCDGAECARGLTFILTDSDARTNDPPVEEEQQPPCCLPTTPRFFVGGLTLSIRTTTTMPSGWYGDFISQYFPNIERLNLRHAKTLELNELNKVVSGVASNKLRRLSVFQCGLTNAHFEGGWCSELEFLHIRSSGANSDSLGLSLLRHTPKLRTLEVEGMGLGFRWDSVEEIETDSGDIGLGVTVGVGLRKLILHQVRLTSSQNEGRFRSDAKTLSDAAFSRFPNLEVLLLEKVKYLKDTAFRDLPPLLRHLRVDRCFWDGDAVDMHCAAGDIIAAEQLSNEIQRVERRMMKMRKGGGRGRSRMISKRRQQEREQGFTFQSMATWS